MNIKTPQSSKYLGKLIWSRGVQRTLRAYFRVNWTAQGQASYCSSKA